MNDDELRKLIAEATKADTLEPIAKLERALPLMAAAPSLAAEALRLRGLVRRMAAGLQVLRDAYFDDGACHGEDCPATCGPAEDCDCEEAKPVAVADALLSEARKAAP